MPRNGSSSRRELLSEKTPARISLTLLLPIIIVSDTARVPLRSARRSVTGDARLVGSGKASSAGKSE
jgi:hypothetical protein